MHRKVYRDLMKWKESGNRKPLLLLGARQVGKTWLMKEFGREQYENVVYINCDSEPLMRTLFLQDYDINRLIIGFQAITGQSVNPGSTLIILDEIQEAARGLHSLKYFCEEASEYHIMAAGSLLGVTLAQKESFPVGKVDIVHLYPLDFEEFLLACGKDALCNIISSEDHSLAETFSSQFTTCLRQYYFTGGMPEAVKAFIETSDLNLVRQIQNNIIEAYRRDISKHSSKTESIRIGQVLSSLPAQLVKENKKFIYGVVKTGGRAADFELAIQWLIDAGLVYKINRVKKAGMPLKFYEDIAAFKLFLLDVGLLGCMADVPSTIVLDDDQNLSEYKGMLAESFVAQQLIACGITSYYWSNDRSPAELDFVIQWRDKVYPIEVKAGTNVRAKSLSVYLKNNPELTGIRFSLLPHKKQEAITNFPLYYLPFIFNH